VDALSCGIAALLTDPSLADRLRSAGFDRARQMTWEKTAEQTLESLERAAEMGPLPASRPSREPGFGLTKAAGEGQEHTENPEN
jgi:hypothetical protein